MTDLTDEVLTIRNLRELLQEARQRNIELARRNAELERRNVELEAEIGALNRHNIELRGAVDALLQPAPSELLAKNTAHPSRQ